MVILQSNTNYIIINIVYTVLTGALIGGVVALSALLVTSLSVNVVTILYCAYQLWVKRQSGAGTGSGGNEEQVYAQVDDHHPGAVTMKHNEAYGQCGHNPRHTTTTIT